MTFFGFSLFKNDMIIDASLLDFYMVDSNQLYTKLKTVAKLKIHALAFLFQPRLN